jgi:hypothetical protein
VRWHGTVEILEWRRGTHFAAMDPGVMSSNHPCVEDAMTDTHTQLQKLDDILAVFERAVLSPVVPGELVEWASAGLASVEDLQSAVANNVEFCHASIFKTISETDPEMLAQVDQLEAEDDSLLASLHETHEFAKTVHTLATAVDRDEEKATIVLKEFVKAAESIDVRLRKQEIAIDLWLRESQTRDRGVKD